MAAPDQPARPHLYSLEDIKDMLAARVDEVAHHYAPEASGSYIDKHLYFTLNPGRADRSVGSFCIHLSGVKAGRWDDFATGQHGDLIDLIALAMGCDISGAIREARAFLGLQSTSPEDKRRREAAAARARDQRRAAEASAAQTRERAKRQAAAIWLSAREDIRSTPVDHYLAARGIDLAALPRIPRAIRYLPDCYAKWMDPETGEVIERKLPAMVTGIVDRSGETVALHRTYLGIGPSGRWGKYPMPTPKKVLGDYAGAAIRLWSGIGPRGGHPGPLAAMPEGSRVYLCEGIEDGLTAALIKPAARILAAISLSNLANVQLPPNIKEVVLIADQDEGEQAAALLQRAIAAHQKAGRVVRVWRNNAGGKDLNDALNNAAKAAMAFADPVMADQLGALAGQSVKDSNGESDD
jgi:hypothetical protein